MSGSKARFYRFRRPFYGVWAPPQVVWRRGDLAAIQRTWPVLWWLA
jgi:hypothetical protein